MNAYLILTGKRVNVGFHQFCSIMIFIKSFKYEIKPILRCLLGNVDVCFLKTNNKAIILCKIREIIHIWVKGKITESLNRYKGRLDKTRRYKPKYYFAMGILLGI